VNYGQFVKVFDLPQEFVAPVELRYENVVATAITREHLVDDVAGINTSLELIRRTRGGEWPSEPTTEDANFIWLVWHELEFLEGKSFTYALYSTEPRYLGCAYLYPPGRRGPLTEELAAFDVDVSWWVTPAGYEQGYYREVYDALRHWLASEFPFRNPYYSNAEIPDERS
jgi:RimJ/RimL family protein N-acetyltransferase